MINNLRPTLFNLKKNKKPHQITDKLKQKVVQRECIDHKLSKWYAAWQMKQNPYARITTLVYFNQCKVAKLSNRKLSLQIFQSDIVQFQ